MTKVTRRLLTSLFDRGTASTYLSSFEYPRNVDMKKLPNCIKLLSALLAHRGALSVLCGAHVMFRELCNLDILVVRGFGFVVNNCPMPANDSSATNPNTGTNVGQLTGIRQTGRPLGPNCLSELR